jgi:TatD DNase family protein
VSGNLVDTHCHLDLAVFDPDRDEVVRRAVESGVTRIVVPAVDLGSLDNVIALADGYTNVHAAIGVHPNDIPADVPLAEVRERLRKAATHPRVVAIGEIGLDFYWKKTPPNVQHEWLQMQLDLACELGLPVILHNRDATPDMLALLTRWVKSGLPASLAGRPGVLHSFSAGWADAEIVLECGFYLGFTGPLTYKNAEEMRAVAAQAPADRILVETDAPFLAPAPHRGKTNEPAFVADTGRFIAEQRQVSLEDFSAQTTRNFKAVFGV